MSPRVQASKNRSRKQWFSVWDSHPPRGFQGHPMNLRRAHSRADCGQKLSGLVLEQGEAQGQLKGVLVLVKELV